MGIGFFQQSENKEGEDDKKKDDGGLFFKRLITSNYDTAGERHNIMLRSSREIAYSLRHTYPMTVLVVNKYMSELGFRTVYVDGEPLWVMYDRNETDI
ncbi:hypothetical protein [Prevotella sp.]|uniref:hypothetical protein n=1 Tax=Prevotella sp. TaxID=59823 RepID=UPI003FEDD301